MPNWCDTEIILFGNEQDLKSLHNHLEQIAKRNRVENGFGNLWEGNLLDSYGIDWHGVDCRGEITNYDLGDNSGEPT